MASSSSSPSSQSLLSLSQIPELLDQITLDVGSTQDLASMALASRQLSEIARRQLRYRDIRARLANKALWDHLAKDKVSAAAVRRLELIRDEQHPSGRLKLPAERVPCDQLRVADSQSTRYEPHTLDLDTIRKHVEIDKQAESALIAALPHMVNMEVFTWDRRPPLLDSRDEGVPDDVWTALGRCSLLRKVHIVDASERNGTDPPGHEPENWSHIKRIHDSSLFNAIGSLTHFGYECWGYLYSEEGPPMAALQEMLCKRCPNLEVLDLQFHLEGSDGLVSMPCDSMLKEARWPAMSALRLVNCTASGEAISAFLASNPQVCKIRPAFTVSQDELDDEDEDIEQGWAVEGVQVPPGCHTTVHDVLWLDMKSALSWSVKHDPRWPLAHEPEFLW